MFLLDWITIVDAELKAYEVRRLVGVSIIVKAPDLEPWAGRYCPSYAVRQYLSQVSATLPIH